MVNAIRSWRVGDTVLERGTGIPHGANVVIGHKPDGRCMMMLIDPPPWMTPQQRAHIYLADPVELLPCQVSSSSASRGW